MSTRRVLKASTLAVVIAVLRRSRAGPEIEPLRRGADAAAVDDLEEGLNLVELAALRAGLQASFLGRVRRSRTRVSARGRGLMDLTWREDWRGTTFPMGERVRWAP
jgi:hypothetical protein